MFHSQRIHDKCYRRPHFDSAQFVESWDDEGARRGYCLYKMGCKGPTAYNAWSTIRWNGGASFPIQAGHPCIGCSEDGFWDKGSFYQHITDVDQFGVEANADKVCLATARVVGVAIASHAAVSTLKRTPRSRRPCSSRSRPSTRVVPRLLPGRAEPPEEVRGERSAGTLVTACTTRNKGSRLLFCLLAEISVPRPEPCDSRATCRTDTMTKTSTTRYDVAEHLCTPEEMAAYLEACLDEADGDAAFVAKALGDIARAKGMSQVARDAGLSRESLYKALSGERAPSLDTILRVVKALGLKLHAEATAIAQEGAPADSRTSRG